MERELASIINYFAIFEYFPSFDDVYTFFPRKISRNTLKNSFEAIKYTVGEYSKSKLKNQKSKVKISETKLKNWRFRLYIKLISLIPQIKLVGLSGSISMMNADLEDDIDLFIITAKDRLFTARFLATIIAYIMGLKRGLGQQKAPNKVCLNLFFDESDLSVPKRKKTFFVGHEILQMKPIIDKDYTYNKFLYANRWVLSFFPNIVNIPNFKFLISNQFQNSNFKNSDNLIENLLKKFQLNLINRHKTSEIITPTQLWFHPEDFEKKIPLDKIL